MTEVTHLLFGDRVGRVSPGEMQRRLTDPAFVAAMRYVQGTDPFGPGPGTG